MTTASPHQIHQVSQSSDQPLREAEQFLYREAYLLDTNKLQEWFELFTHDCTYWVPLEANQTDPLGTCSIICDDHRLLNVRVRQASHARAHARNPLARTCHQVSNVMIMQSGQPDTELLVRSNLILIEYRQDRQRVFAGACEYRLKRSSGGLKIAAKRVDIVNSEAELDGIAVLF